MGTALSSEQLNTLFNDYGITYLKRTHFKVKLSEKQTIGSAYFKDNLEEFRYLHRLYHDKIINGYKGSASVHYLGDTLGHGLFADRDYQSDEFFAEYTGLVKNAGRTHKMKDTLGGFSSDYAWTYPVTKGFRRLEVDGRLWGNETRFINHSFTPNLRMEHYLGDEGWILFLLFERDVKQGEQLTVNYGEEYWIGGFRELQLI